MPTREDCGVTVHSCARNRWTVASSNQSVRGPNVTGRVTTAPACGRSGPRPGSVTAPAARPAGASASPAISGAGPICASVSVAQESSTGATSNPPRIAR